MEKDKHFTEDEIVKRRDEVIRRMANTPPQPKSKSRRPKRGKKAVAGRAAGRVRARRDD